MNLGYVKLLTIPFILVSTFVAANQEVQESKIATDPQSGLVIAEGSQLVLAHCSACHSPSLIAQNAMSKDRWLETIRWMQSTQKLWPLGDAEPVILDYLATWYGPKKSSRRPPIPQHLMPFAKNPEP